MGGVFLLHACLLHIGIHRYMYSPSMVLRTFQEYFAYIEPIVNQRWAKTGVPEEKPPDLPVQNLASHMYPREARTTAVTDQIFKSQRSEPLYHGGRTIH